MIRWITILSALLLMSGCVTTREVVYRDRYYDDGYAESRYEDRHYRDGSYYSPPVSGRGDYYYRAPAWHAGSAMYWDYPAYYSVFWPMYRSWYDPFFHPHYYYGVTYYPRNYFSLGFGFGRSWGWGGSLFYSPYRYSWVDNYYDWTPWYRHRHRHYSPPRYGSALNEAERLARMGDSGRSHGGTAYSSIDARGHAIDRYGRTRGDARAADYGREPAPRREPGFSGFGVREANGEVRRVGTGTRATPVESGFAVPVDGSRRIGAGARGADYGERAPLGRDASRGSWNAERAAPQAEPRRVGRGWDAYSAPREAELRTGRYQRAPAAGDVGRGARYEHGRNLPREAAYGREAPPTGGPYAAPLPRGYAEAPHAPAPTRGYDAGGYAPMPRAEPRYESHYEARPEPRYESRSESRPEPRYERSESRSSEGDVRRVGSRRED